MVDIENLVLKLNPVSSIEWAVNEWTLWAVAVNLMFFLFAFQSSEWDLNLIRFNRTLPSMHLYNLHHFVLCCFYPREVTYNCAWSNRAPTKFLCKLTLFHVLTFYTSRINWLDLQCCQNEEDLLLCLLAALTERKKNDIYANQCERDTVGIK